jgi:hypothetical protein
MGAIIFFLLLSVPFFSEKGVIEQNENCNDVISIIKSKILEFIYLDQIMNILL